MRKVIVISENSLFREGLQRLIASTPDLRLLGAFASTAEVAQLADDSAPDAVILDQAQDTPGGRQVLAQLLDLAAEQVFVISLHERAVTVYSRLRLQEASAQTLLDLLSDNPEGELP